jgi:hypothetical protein
MYNQTAAGGQPEKFLLILTRFFYFILNFYYFLKSSWKNQEKKKVWAWAWSARTPHCRFLFSVCRVNCR